MSFPELIRCMQYYVLHKHYFLMHPEMIWGIPEFLGYDRVQRHF
jgi:hypothetical protein